LGDAWRAGAQGAVNFGGGFVNGAADLVNMVADGAVNAIIPGCQLNALGAGAPWCFNVPDIPDIPIWGDYDTFKYSSWAGSLSFQAAVGIATAGMGSGGAAAGTGTSAVRAESAVASAARAASDSPATSSNDLRNMSRGASSLKLRWTRRRSSRYQGGRRREKSRSS
jgi:hypothetical protein